MKYFFDYWSELEKEIVDKHVLLSLDYDGTLASLARKPDQAVIHPQTKELLQQLSENLLRSYGIREKLFCGFWPDKHFF